jgi:hypothetical protein
MTMQSCSINDDSNGEECAVAHLHEHEVDVAIANAGQQVIGNEVDWFVVLGVLWAIEVGRRFDVELCFKGGDSQAGNEDEWGVGGKSAGHQQPKQKNAHGNAAIFEAAL